MSKQVPVEDLVLEERCQARSTVDHDAVSEYAERYSDGKPMPPPAAFRVSGKLVVVDGYHRVPAAIKAGVAFLRVDVVGEGTLDDAVWYATSVNKSHGVRRTNEDKRRAVRMALESEIGQEQSSRAIAEHVGVSHDFVARLRKQWERTQSEPEVSSDDTSKPAEKPAPVSSNDTPPSPAVSSNDNDEAPIPLNEPLTAEPMPGYGGSLRSAADEISKLRRRVVSSLPDEVNAQRQRVDKSLKAAETTCRAATPIVCAGCEGKGCERCGWRGWATKVTADEGWEAAE